MYQKGIRSKIVGNQKVVNATRCVYNGVKYRSQLEAFTAHELDFNQIKFEYEKNKFCLQEKFTSLNPSVEEFEVKGVNKFEELNPNIRAITLTPDFMDIQFRWCLEVKGHRTSDFDLKWKMFKEYLHRNDLKMDLYLPTNQKQVKQVIEIIKNKYK